MRKIKSILLMNETVCLKLPAQRYRLCARDCARSLINEYAPFYHRIQGAFTLLLPKIIHQEDTREADKVVFWYFMKFWIALLTLSFGGKGDLWHAAGIEILPLYSEFRQEFWYENCHDYFPVSSLKVAARLGACLPSFLPGGKLCDWVITTLVDPAGTVSCNLICKEIIRVIDRHKQLLSDKSTLSWTP